MDLCSRFHVDGQCSLYVTGIENSNEDVTSVFEINGEIYVSDKCISVRTIRDVAQEDVGKERACRYLEELKAVAGSGKAGFLSIFQSEMDGIHEAAPQSTDNQLIVAQDMSNHDSTNGEGNEPTESIAVHNAPAYARTNQVISDESIFNPPSIQKVIIEHVIRNESVGSASTQPRIRSFSGRVPRPNGEVDYDTWRTQIDFLPSDFSLNDGQKVRRILESLLSPAAEVIKMLGVNSPPKVYVTQLDSAFGVVEDGEELYATLLNAFLNRLYSLLTRAISRGGASARDTNDRLLRQFCRGCWDQSLIIGLQLEYKKNDPPSFPELLLMLRTEEDRRSAMLDRMKKHLGSAKATAHAQSILEMPLCHQECESTPNTNAK